MPSSCRPAIMEGPRHKEQHMHANQSLWIKRLATGAAMIALPLTVMAHGPAGDAAENCAPMPQTGGPTALQPYPIFPPALLPGMFPEFPPPGAIPQFLRGLALTEAQEDKLFSLMHAGMPRVREQLRAASKATEELHGLAASDKFDADKARALANTQASAMAQVVLMHAEFDAKVRALLTPEQRKRFDDARIKANSHHNFTFPM